MSTSKPKVQGFTWTVEDTNLVTQTEIYGEVLVELAKADPRIVCLSADLAHSTKMGVFQKAFPERFVNIGIAEQNLMAVAAGLAATGLVPVVSTYAAFASLRAAEFVRTDIAYNRRNVKILGTLSGVSFGQGGPTHHSGEDLALMRAIPGMAVIAPCDGWETGAAMRAAVAHEGPVYLRIGRSVEHAVYARPEDVRFTLGKAETMREGGDLTVVATGIAVYHALLAAERAARAGAKVRVLNVHTLKPLDEEAIRRAVVETRRVITVEDHNVVNGLGSAVADVIAASGKACGFRKLGHQDRFLGMGIPEDLVHLGGFDEDGILAAIEELLKVRVPTDEDWDG